ncbi:uncharacterized protein [Physcomitrium patens]|uniref:uncharacterized protein isoform X2 n=1 Tax=Physcomitrium patens TaxID=3218 RepID=UPI003CCD9124
MSPLLHLMMHSSRHLAEDLCAALLTGRIPLAGSCSTCSSLGRRLGCKLLVKQIVCREVYIGNLDGELCQKWRRACMLKVRFCQWEVVMLDRYSRFLGIRFAKSAA